MDDAAFGERLVAAVHDGQRTGSHKLHLMLAILDEVPASADPETGAPPAVLDLAQVASRVLDLTLRHAAPMATTEQLRFLTGSSKRNSLITAGRVARESAGWYDAAPRTLEQLRRTDPHAAEQAVTSTFSGLVKNPVPRLQGAHTGGEFLYHWPHTSTSRRTIANEQGHADPVLPLLPGAAERLLRLGPLVRELVESTMVRDVLRWSHLQGDDVRVRDHLFGQRRRALPTHVRRALLEVQKERCFYAGDHLALRQAHVDHFLPWSRYRLDVAENLVLTRSGRNLSKSDLLPHPKYVSPFLATLEARGRCDPGSRSSVREIRSVLAAAYSSLPLGSPVWVDGDRYRTDAVLYDEAGRTRVLTALQE